MSNEDRDVVLIADPKVVQARIDAQLREKALQGTAEEKVSLAQLGIWQGSVSESNSKAIDVSTFNMKEDITSALSFVEEARMILDDFNPVEPDHAVRKLHKRLCRAARSMFCLGSCPGRLSCQHWHQVHQHRHSGRRCQGGPQWTAHPPGANPQGGDLRVSSASRPVSQAC